MMEDIASKIPFGLLELAKHAPEKPADWFHPLVGDQPEVPSTGDSDAAWSNYVECKKDWGIERDRQVTLQWPLAWAQGVLEAAQKMGLTEQHEPIWGIEDDSSAAIIALTRALTSAIGMAKFAGEHERAGAWIQTVSKYGIFSEGAP